jgi:hypothetical protein
MRFFAVVFSILSIFVAVASAQTADDEMTENYKLSFRQVNVVAHIEVEKVKIDAEWGKPKTGGGYTIYRFTGKIAESFKGKYKKGETIIFYSLIEGQPPPENLKKNFIRFLEIKKTETGQKQLLELENSAAAVNQANLKLFRKLR